MSDAMTVVVFLGLAGALAVSFLVRERRLQRRIDEIDRRMCFLEEADAERSRFESGRRRQSRLATAKLLIDLIHSLRAGGGPRSPRTPEATR